MRTAYIFCPSRILNKEKIKIPTSYRDDGDIYIAADSGIETALKLNIKPDIIIGDFDSYDLSELNRNGYTDDIKIIKYPSEKNDTDSMLAVKYALESGYKNIAVIGGIDGRIDHTLANLFYLKYIKINGGDGYITEGYNKIIYIANSSVKIYKEYKYVSILPVSPEISGVTLKGVKYPLINANVRFEEPYTVCNEILNDVEYGEIEIKNGEALICQCDDM